MRKFTKLWHLAIVILLSSGVMFAQNAKIEQIKSVKEKGDVTKATDQLKNQEAFFVTTPGSNEMLSAVKADNQIKKEKLNLQKPKKDEIPTAMFSEPVFTDGMDCPPGTVFGLNATGYTSAGNSDVDGGYKMFQYFTGMGTPITAVHWWGINAYFDGVGWVGCTENPRAYEVQIWSDAAGLPGVQLSPTYSGTITGVGTGVFFAGSYEIFEYTLPVSYTLASGWVSIQGNPGGSNTCWFLWVNSGTPGTLSQQYDIAAGTYTASTAPASLCLLGAASFANDVAVTAINTPVSGPAGVQSVNITVTNFGSASQSNIPVNYTYGGNTYTGTVPGPIGYLETATYPFTQTINPPIGANTITSCTALGSDQNTANDCFTKNFTITPSFACNWTIELTDSYGDGWNGCNMDVIVDTYTLLDNITLASGTGPVVFTFGVNTGSAISTTFAIGSWPEECAYTIKDNYGVIVATSGPTGVAGVPPPNVNLTGSCVVLTCPPPTNLGVNSITANSAILTWASNSGSSNIEIVLGTGPFTGVPTPGYTAITSPHSTGNTLLQSSTYSYKVQDICPGEVSTWAGPFTFNTTCVVTCPPGSTIEPEIAIIPDNYVDNTNGGCNSTPNVWGSIVPGETICGTSGTYTTTTGDSRDTDWFRFDGTTSGPGTWDFTWTASGEFDMLVFIIQTNGGLCTGQTFWSAVADPCQPATVTQTGLNADIFDFWVGPSVFTGYPPANGPYDYVATLTATFHPFVPTYAITGTLKYANPANTPMDATTIDLMQGASVVDTDVTNGLGQYSLTAPDGAYTLASTTTKPRGGLDALDIILTKRWLGFLHTFTPIQLIAADVNESGLPDALDVIMMKRKLGNQTTPSWYAADYIFYDENVTVAGGPVVHNYQSLCAGDVNGSYTPIMQVPANDECSNPTAVAGPYPVIGITGTTVYATPSCPLYMDPVSMPSGEVWYAIDLPHANNTVVIDLCGNALLDNGWIIGTTVQCSCDGLDYLVASGFTFTAPCVTNMTWTNVPGPGTFYYPVATGTVQEGFTMDVDVTLFVPVMGVDCSLPVSLTLPAALPYANSNTTCGMLNDYDATTLMGLYDGGEDIIYQITVTSTVTIDITLDPLGTTYSGIGLFNGCPDLDLGIVGSNMSGSSVHGVSNVILAPGTYYLMIDTWPAPDCIPTFNLTIVASPVGVYCAATTATFDEYISNVTIGTINNTTSWQGGVAFYNVPTDISQGTPLTITVTNPVPYASDLVTVWVDWNDDYTYDVATEAYPLLNVGGTGASFTGSINAAGKPLGNHRMRVRMTYSVAPVPCGASTYGEVEEYILNVIL